MYKMEMCDAWKSASVRGVRRLGVDHVIVKRVTIDVTTVERRNRGRSQDERPLPSTKLRRALSKSRLPAIYKII
jgi:hypothetical protein